MLSKLTDSIVIVGAGCFGISTAYHLLKRGYQNVTIVDRSEVLPAPDAASTDLNKVVRSSYSDIFYAKLAQDAIRSWKEDVWGNSYHESGVLVLGRQSASGGGTYANEAYHNDRVIGARLKTLDDADSIRSVFPSRLQFASFEGLGGYINYDGGWVHAAKGVSIMTSQVMILGGKVVSGKTVSKVLRRNGATSGISCTDGTVFNADLVVLATGSWTASAFPDLEFDEKFVATGQAVVTIKLDEEEASVYRHCPVVLDFDSGFYVFPPNEDNLMKLAIHTAGYTHKRIDPTSGRAVSTPRTILSHPEDGSRIPRSAAQAIRYHLREVYPDLAEKPFIGTRLCWYTDSPDGDWVIGFYPSDTSLLLATAGSGHAYKFFPIIGRLVADAMEGKLEAALVDKFAVNRVYTSIDKSRSSTKMQELNLDELVAPEDLLP